MLFDVLNMRFGKYFVCGIYFFSKYDSFIKLIVNILGKLICDYIKMSQGKYFCRYCVFYKILLFLHKK